MSECTLECSSTMGRELSNSRPRIITLKKTKSPILIWIYSTSPWSSNSAKSRIPKRSSLPSLIPFPKPFRLTAKTDLSRISNPGPTESPFHWITMASKSTRTIWTEAQFLCLLSSRTEAFLMGEVRMNSQAWISPNWPNWTPLSRPTSPPPADSTTSMTQYKKWIKRSPDSAPMWEIRGSGKSRESTQITASILLAKLLFLRAKTRSTTRIIKATNLICSTPPRTTFTPISKT